MLEMKIFMVLSGVTAVLVLLSGVLGARRAMAPACVAPYRTIMEVALGIVLCAIAGILAVLSAFA